MYNKKSSKSHFAFSDKQNEKIELPGYGISFPYQFLCV